MSDTRVLHLDALARDLAIESDVAAVAALDLLRMRRWLTNEALGQHVQSQNGPPWTFDVTFPIRYSTLSHIIELLDVGVVAKP